MNVRNNNISTRFSNDKLLIRYLRLLLWINRISYKEPYIKMMNTVIKRKNNNGNKWLCAYLKLAKQALDHYISGNPVSHLGQCPRIAMARGIPLIIPKSLHFHIERGDEGPIRVIQGVLSVFRILPVKGELKISTITDPFEGVSTTLNWTKVADIWTRLFLPLRGLNPVGRSFLLNLKTAGPNHKVSILGAASDAFMFASRPDLQESLRIISNYFSSDLNHLLDEEIRYLKGIEPKALKEFILGKLSTKVEAAGKVRVFAIVDVWTQTCLESIHKHIFSILKKIPNDGCFDQDKPLQRLLKKKFKQTFCYDLSAATDRFPIDFQKQILCFLYTRDVAEAWVNLLVNRDYVLKASKAFGPEQRVKYAVGQPMGALSSWGVFSLCHHFIVQYAASEKGFTTWFDDYALLGDDIVICNKEVALHYHYIMTEILGVKINLSKSLQSDKGVIEFAKRIITPTSEFSPIGPKNIALALKAPAHLSTVLLDYTNKGGKVQQAQKLISTLSNDIVNISRGKIESLIWSTQGPFGFLDSGHCFGPKKAENMLPWLKDYFWRNSIESLDLFDRVFNKVLIDDLRENVSRSQLRSMLTINKYKDLVEIPNFESDTVQQLPSFRGFMLTAYEETLKTFDMIPDSLPRSYADTVAKVVKHKCDALPNIYPTDNCLIANKVQRPRFRSPNIDFWRKVLVNLNLELEMFKQNNMDLLKHKNIDMRGVLSLAISFSRYEGNFAAF